MFIRYNGFQKAHSDNTKPCYKQFKLLFIATKHEKKKEIIMIDGYRNLNEPPKTPVSVFGDGCEVKMRIPKITREHN